MKHQANIRLIYYVKIHCNLDLVTLSVFTKTVTKSHNVTTHQMILCSKLKNGL